ncbi:MAG TPA: GNAT family N-acetyltransferase [Solirubrobacteraceae bacterium]|nr:GNAT family N-acetyltransferase [Solirubrobacteraceae bacterium]
MPGAAPLALRRATAADEAFLYRVYASTRADELAGTGWDEDAKEAFLRMQYEAQARSYRAAHPDACFDLVLVHGTPAGRLCVDRDGAAIHVVDIALLPEHRGRGVGTQLLGALLAEAAGAARRVTLSVERSNPAARLYARLGFEVVRPGDVYSELEWSPPPLRSLPAGGAPGAGR